MTAKDLFVCHRLAHRVHDLITRESKVQVVVSLENTLVRFVRPRELVGFERDTFSFNEIKYLNGEV